MTRGGRGGAARLAIACLGLGLAGCGGSPAGEAKGTGVVAAPPVAKDPAAPAILGDRLASVAATAPASSPQQPSPFRFADIARQGGIDFVHFSGMTEQKHFPTANGSGAAMFDYDGDGRLDLYFATATLLPLGTAKKGPNRLYKNLGGGKFRDVTEASGLGFVGYCHGIIVGDLDNDGDQDVFLCNYGPNVLYLNNGDGTFRDISKAAGIDRPNWSSGGAMLDYDNDGDLDIYVANYGEWRYPEDAHYCGTKEVHLYCSPKEIRTVKHILYRNNGDGTFTDVADLAGVGRDDGHGFGVVAADINGDGKIDLYIANDMNPNFLYLNKGDGTFDDYTLLSGAALDEGGKVQSGMGADTEDCDGDGRPELFVTNFQNEYNTYYQNLGSPAANVPGQVTPVSFLDSTAFVGLAADSLPWVGWGCALADFDNDGWPDCFVANGHVDDNRRALRQNVDYAEPPLLHRNVPAGDPKKPDPGAGRRFTLSTLDVGPYFATKHVARGAAFGDLDDDGDLDIVINHKDGSPAVLRNDTPGDNCWIRLNLVGTRSNRDAVGSHVEVKAADRTISRQRKGGCSMQSANDPRLLIGLGPAKEVERLTIRWPSGTVSTLDHLAVNTTYRVVEPKDKEGKAVAVALPKAESPPK